MSNPSIPPELRGGRIYPLPRPDDDPRFTHGLLFDVARAIRERGYPPVTDGGDLVALQQALFGFLYEPAVGGER